MSIDVVKRTETQFQKKIEAKRLEILREAVVHVVQNAKITEIVDEITQTIVMKYEHLKITIVIEDV